MDKCVPGYVCCLLRLRPIRFHPSWVPKGFLGGFIVTEQVDRVKGLLLEFFSQNLPLGRTKIDVPRSLPHSRRRRSGAVGPRLGSSGT